MDRRDLLEQRASFLAALVGGMLGLMLDEPVGAALGIGDPATGHFVVVTYASAPIAIVAALVSRRWRGLLGMLAGFAVAGGVAGVFADLGSSGDLVTDVIASGLIVLLSMGAVGVPVYLATMAVISLVSRRRRPDDAATGQTATTVPAATSPVAPTTD